MVCRKYRVSGRVQGVFYRASAQARARELGITGCARNLPDGCVEVVACGDPDQLDRFVEWLRSGPTAAHVASVESAEHQPATWPTDFLTG